MHMGNSKLNLLFALICASVVIVIYFCDYLPDVMSNKRSRESHYRQHGTQWGRVPVPRDINRDVTRNSNDENYNGKL